MLGHIEFGLGRYSSATIETTGGQPLPIVEQGRCEQLTWTLNTQRLYLRKLQEPLGVQMTDLLLIRRTDGCAIQEHSPLLIRAIGIIDRENYAIGSHGLQGAQKWGISEEATNVLRSQWFAWSLLFQKTMFYRIFPRRYHPVYRIESGDDMA